MTPTQAFTPPAKPFRSVWFDCDSTLATIEGIDELVDRLPAETQSRIRSLTDQAMNGEIPLEDVYLERMRLVAPTEADLAEVGRRYLDHATPGALELVQALQDLGKTVGIISGGLLPPVQDFAMALGIDPLFVQAVPLCFDNEGRYEDIDRESPLWRSGGKANLLDRLPPSQRPAAHIGDGATDLESIGIADTFIGFGGVVRREAVATTAQIFVEHNHLGACLPHLLTAAEWQRLSAMPQHATLLHWQPGH